MNLYSLTKEKIAELEKLKNKKEMIFNDLENKKPEDIWLEELETLDKYLNKNY